MELIDNYIYVIGNKEEKALRTKERQGLIKEHENQVLGKSLNCQVKEIKKQIKVEPRGKR